MKIVNLQVLDVRFPTSLEGDGSDAVHEPDYSCAYVILDTDSGIKGFGFTFTIGRGTDIVCKAVEAYKNKLIGRNTEEIFNDFCGFFRELTQDNQMRWLGPEKGVTHLAAAAILNALWDLWGKIENKPVWKLLVDMEPEKLVSTIDFTYIEDALTKDEALAILRNGRKSQTEREKEIRENGHPAYTTAVGWLGYSDDKIKRLCKQSLAEGFTRFKLKVGVNIEDDIRRVNMVRSQIGEGKMLSVDANQRWGVQQSIDWMKQLAKFDITWIEEPTSPDDVLGHAEISKTLAPYGIGVATGECCQNRVMFKQFFQANGFQFCQIDAARMAGPNEIMAVILMAKKFKIPVCPHAGGVGLCELVNHLSIWDFVSVSGHVDERVTEYVDNLHEHFVDPVVVKNGCYQVPTMPGYSAEIKQTSLEDYTYPGGKQWQRMFKEGLFKPPN